MAPFNITSINSINISRILAQITFYFVSYFSLIRSGKFNPSSDLIRFAVPTGNFGDILAGFFAKRMGLPISQLIIATNENDILHRFWQTGIYDKLTTDSNTPAGTVKETMSPAMDILISSNFERLLWFLAYDVYSCNVEGFQNKWQVASLMVKEWQAAFLRAYHSQFASLADDIEATKTLNEQQDAALKDAITTFNASFA